jgi:hypothetical protein
MTRIILNNGTFLVGADFRPVTGMMAITDGRITQGLVKVGVTVRDRMAWWFRGAGSAWAP